MKYICDILWFSDKVWKSIHLFVNFQTFSPSDLCLLAGWTVHQQASPEQCNSFSTLVLDSRLRKGFVQCACIVWHIVWKCADAADMARYFGAHYEIWQNMHYCAMVGFQFSVCYFFRFFKLWFDNLTIWLSVRISGLRKGLRSCIKNQSSYMGQSLINMLALQPMFKLYWPTLAGRQGWNKHLKFLFQNSARYINI